MKCEEKVKKRITRTPCLGVLMRYRARVVFLLSGLLIIIVHSRWGQTLTTYTNKRMKVNVFIGFKFQREALTLLNLTLPSRKLLHRKELNHTLPNQETDKTESDNHTLLNRNQLNQIQDSTKPYSGKQKLAKPPAFKTGISKTS